MIGLPSGTRVWIVAGHTAMRKGFDGLAALVQTALAENPFCGHVFVFRGRRGDILKVLWFDGQGLMLLAKRLERGRFVWPQAEPAPVRSPAAVLLPVSIEATPREIHRTPPAPQARSSSGTIEIEIGSARVRLRGPVDEASLRTVLTALRSLA